MCDDVFHGNSLRHGGEARLDAVPQDGIRKRIDIIKGDVEASLHQCADFSGGDERLTGTRACPEPDVLFRVFRCRRKFGMRRRYKLHRVHQHVVHDRDLFCDGTHRKEFISADDRLCGLRHGRLRHLNDRSKLLCRRETDDQLEQETVGLRFGQRIGTVLFDGILRRKNEKRLRKAVGLSVGGDGVFLHRFEKCGLRFRCCTVDFVREKEVCEDWPGTENKTVLSVFVLFNDVRAGDVGRHQVRGELDAGKRKRQCLSHRAHQAGFADARHTFEQDVAARNDGDDNTFHHVALTDHVPADLAEDAVDFFREKENVVFVYHYVLLRLV